LDGAAILGVTPQFQLCIKETLTSDWIPLPADKPVINVTSMPDGTIIGVGTDNRLYTRTSLLSRWIPVPDNGLVIDISYKPGMEVS